MLFRLLLSIHLVDIFVFLGCMGASVTPYGSKAKYDCSRDEYYRCVTLADPLIREPNLVFPDNMEDIDAVCRTWNQFVDCLKRYTDICFTDQQRKVFNKAVENPIESVHLMCTQTSYQTEYLKYASCIKSTVTEVTHCGPQYALLVEQVSKGDAIARASLCCSHHRFKQCVVRETERLCDNGVPDGNAARFSTQIIDKALSFLQDQCYNYIPNSGDCPLTTTTMDQLYTGSSYNTNVRSTWRSNTGATNLVDNSMPPSTNSVPNERGLSDGSIISSIGPNTDSNYYQGGAITSGSTLSAQNGDFPSVHVDNTRETIYNTQEKPVSNPIDPNTMKIDQSTEVSWMPGDHSGQIGNGMTSPDMNRDSTLSIISGGRTRPSSYGRSSSWTPSPPVLSSVKPEWATLSTWHVYSQETGEKRTTVTETWYPAAGSYAGNSIDEPNQQGLSKAPKSAAIAVMKNTSALPVFICILLIALSCN